MWSIGRGQFWPQDYNWNNFGNGLLGEKVREKSRECHNYKPRPQKKEETDKSKQAQTEQTYEKH